MNLGKGVEELISEFKNRGHTAGFMSCTIAILYFLTIYGLETIGSSTAWRPAFRGLLADYAYPVRFVIKYANYKRACSHSV